MQMSNDCESRATSKILYYRWVYNIVSLLFLTLMIVGVKEILLLDVLDGDGCVSDTYRISFVLSS